MKKVEKMLDKYKVSRYALLRAMGLHPVDWHSAWSRKLRGELPISPKEYDMLHVALEKVIPGEDFVNIVEVDKYRAI
jgi:hypothetical protein